MVIFHSCVSLPEGIVVWFIMILYPLATRVSPPGRFSDISYVRGNSAGSNDFCTCFKASQSKLKYVEIPRNCDDCHATEQNLRQCLGSKSSHSVRCLPVHPLLQLRRNVQSIPINQQHQLQSRCFQKMGYLITTYVLYLSLYIYISI